MLNMEIFQTEILRKGQDRRNLQEFMNRRVSIVLVCIEATQWKTTPMVISALLKGAELQDIL